MRAVELARVVIAVVVLAAYHNGFSGLLVFDDLVAIRDNLSIRSLVASVRPLPDHGLTTADRLVAYRS